MEGADSLLPPRLLNPVKHVLQDEAFSIWAGWASFYPPESSQRELLDKVQATRWLVSVVHHDFKCPDALWSFLLDCMVQL